MYLPQQYINNFLGQDYMPRHAYKMMTAMVVVDGAEVACAPLLDWLRATCTRVQLANGVALEALPLA